MQTLFIPAIDIINGACVRLRQGNFEKQTTYSQPVEAIVENYVQHGAQRIHLVDLDAAAGQGSNRKLIHELKKQFHVTIQVGGGIRTKQDVEAYLEAGIDHLIIGSAAVTHPEEVTNWILSFGANHFIIGADVLNQQVMIHGWKTASEWTLDQLVMHYFPYDVECFLCTDIEKDGMMTGPSPGMYALLMHKLPGLKIIASGGVSDISDVKAIAGQNLYGAVIGKALLEGNVSLKSLCKYFK